jgi:hypothetical protein
VSASMVPAAALVWLARGVGLTAFYRRLSLARQFARHVRGMGEGMAACTAGTAVSPLGGRRHGRRSVAAGRATRCLRFLITVVNANDRISRVKPADTGET